MMNNPFNWIRFLSQHSLNLVKTGQKQGFSHVPASHFESEADSFFYCYLQKGYFDALVNLEAIEVLYVVRVFL